KKKDLLIVSSSERRGLPYWLLGSFAETAALTATIPVMIIKPDADEQGFSEHVNFVVGVDVAATPSARALGWIAKAAKICNAHVELVYVKSKFSPLTNILKKSKKESTDAQHILQRCSQTLKGKGVQSNISIIES